MDDNELNRDALSRLLAQNGYLVDMAGSGDEALVRIAAGKYDLVLLDVEMPGLSGLEALSRIRAVHSQTELPVIVVTARTQGTDIVEALSLGANDYVSKPVDFPVALARIQTHLSHRRAVGDLRESEERYALAARGANDGLWDWNVAANEVYWSPRWKAMLGYDGSEIDGKPEEWLSRIHHEDAAIVRASLDAYLSSGAGHFESEHRLLHRDGSYRWMLCRGAARSDERGIVTRFAGSLTDITETKVADALTGLPNRLLFVDVLERAIRRAERRPDYRFALLVLGLDRFKTVNESLGVLSADRLLVAVARRLQSSLRGTDVVTHEGSGFTLARLGSDEFTVLIDDITDASDAVRVAERLRAALTTPFYVDGRQVYTSAAVGITVSTTGYDRPQDVLQDAAIALHRAKADGSLPYELFDPAMRARAIDRLQVETDLRMAIDKNQFTVFYQPIISLVTGRIIGFEALARWQHPTRGLLDPVEFIPLAEDTGLIRQVGRLILAESCRQMAAWQQRFGRQAPGVMCVNVSANQFSQGDLAGEIESMLRETGLEGAKLKLEITESVFIGDIVAAENTLKRLQAIGVQWSIDDFGTGYSSLSCLHRLQADTVKVDRSFVSRLGTAGNGVEMVRAILALATSLGMDVVAEGVETSTQLAELQQLGCESAQGFYFSRPVDRDTARGLIDSQPWYAGDHASHLAMASIAPSASDARSSANADQ